MAKLNEFVQRFLGGDNPRLKVNLKKIFKKDISKSPGLKEAIGQALVDKILDHTSNSKTWKGTTFAGYSKAYKESDEFKAFKRSGKVNLKLKGDMLAMLDFESDGNIIKMSWDDSTEAAKAHGHITKPVTETSRVGKRTISRTKGGPRDFFGLSKKEIDDVRKEFSSKVAAASGPSQDDLIALALQAIARSRSEDGS